MFPNNVLLGTSHSLIISWCAKGGGEHVRERVDIGGPLGVLPWIPRPYSLLISWSPFYKTSSIYRYIRIYVYTWFTYIYIYIYTYMISSSRSHCRKGGRRTGAWTPRYRLASRCTEHCPSSVMFPWSLIIPYSFSLIIFTFPIITFDPHFIKSLRIPQEKGAANMCVNASVSVGLSVYGALSIFPNSSLIPNNSYPYSLIIFIFFW